MTRAVAPPEPGARGPAGVQIPARAEAPVAAPSAVGGAHPPAAKAVAARGAPRTEAAPEPGGRVVAATAPTAGSSVQGRQRPPAVATSRAVHPGCSAIRAAAPALAVSKIPTAAAC